MDKGRVRVRLVALTLTSLTLSRIAFIDIVAAPTEGVNKLSRFLEYIFVFKVEVYDEDLAG